MYPWADLRDWPPEYGELHSYAADIGYTDRALREFMEHWIAEDWTDEKGVPSRDAKLLLRTHMRDLMKDGLWTPRATRRTK